MREDQKHKTDECFEYRISVNSSREMHIISRPSVKDRLSPIIIFYGSSDCILLSGKFLKALLHEFYHSSFTACKWLYQVSNIQFFDTFVFDRKKSKTVKSVL